MNDFLLNEEKILIEEMRYEKNHPQDQRRDNEIMSKLLLMLGILSIFTYLNSF